MTAAASTSSSIHGRQVGLSSVTTSCLLSHFHVRKHPHDLLCLSSADAVFLDDEKEREECVMTEMGIIYHGAFDDVAERNWNYGQVDDKTIKDFRTDFPKYYF